MYQVVVERAAEKDLKRLSATVRPKALVAITGGFPPGALDTVPRLG